MSLYCLWGKGPNVTFCVQPGLSPALHSWFIVLQVFYFLSSSITMESRILKFLLIELTPHPLSLASGDQTETSFLTSPEDCERAFLW